MERLCRLYLITPPAIADLAAFAADLGAAMAAGDAAALQIRLKPAGDGDIEAAVSTLGPIVRRRGASLILNDRPDLAARLDCDGVHIGQSDGSVTAARAAVGPDRIVGVTCHASRDLAMAAADEGCDYVAFGAFFPTATKETIHRPDPDILTVWQEMTVTPCVAIGGITVENCRSLAAAGADFIAVCSGVWSHPAGPAAAVAAYTAEIAKGIADRRASSFGGTPPGAVATLAPLN